MVKIAESRTYKSLGEIADPAERLRVAGEAGRGLAIYGDFTCRMRTDGLENPLPGYRDTRLYYNQLRSVLAGSRTPEDAGALIPRGRRRCATARKSTFSCTSKRPSTGGASATRSSAPSSIWYRRRRPSA